MADHVSSDRRSKIMAAVKGKNTGPEMVVRKLLHQNGFRFRLHRRELPGCPDIVLAKFRAVIFVNGCFWHGHGCLLSKKLPQTRNEFWSSKIARNRIRDENVIEQLIFGGWRVCTVWECAIKRRNRIPPEQLISTIKEWIAGAMLRTSISGQSSSTQSL